MFLLDRLRHKGRFEQLGFTSDCHCHLLPGVDDGSGSYEESVTVIREMISIGIHTAVLTPHINADIYPSNTESLIKARYEGFVSALPHDIQDAMTLSLGAEYMVTGDFEHRSMTQLIQFKPGKVLIEMSYLYKSPNIEQVLFELTMAGIVPVIAHPERYLYLAFSLDTFERYHDMGAEFQMNLLSLSGAYGPASMRILKYINEKGWYSHYGTDAHHLSTIHSISTMRFDASLVKDKTVLQ